jgi:hypothetical protein
MGTSAWDQSTTAASNTDIGGVNQAEGCAPSTLNNATRGLAAQMLGALLGVAAAGTNTITVTVAPAPDALVTHMRVLFKAANANTSAATLQVNSLTAKNLYKLGTSGPTALTGGEIQAGQYVEVVYDGTQWVMASQQAATASSTGSSMAGQLVALNSSGKIASTLLSGTVVQSVNTETGAVATGTTTIPWDDTIPQNTEGDQYMSLAITPTNANSVLDIIVVFNFSNSGSIKQTLALFEDSTANALAAAWDTADNADASYQIVLRHRMTAGTTSSTTFKVRSGGSAAGTTTFNGSAAGRKLGGVLASSITITEYLP